MILLTGTGNLRTKVGMASIDGRDLAVEFLKVYYFNPVFAF